MPGCPAIGNNGAVPAPTTRTAFESVDGYALVDLPGADATVGPVRCARKVLERTTTDLIRHATYALALHGEKVVGAAVALNHDRSEGDPAELERFGTELAAWADSTGFRPVTGLGLGLAEVGASGPDVEAANIESAVAAAGRLTGCTVVVTGVDDDSSLRSALEAQGVNSVRFEADVAAALAIECDIAFTKTGVGALDHEALAQPGPARIISLNPLAMTARGLAVASRAGTTMVPDFLSAAGQYLAALDRVDITEATHQIVDQLSDAGVESFVRACEQAEDHLRTWASELPFGRPLAP